MNNFEAIEKITGDMLEILSAWNGEDDKFSVGGIEYNEESVNIAEDILGHCKEIRELLEELEQ